MIEWLATAQEAEMIAKLCGNNSVDLSKEFYVHLLFNKDLLGWISIYNIDDFNREAELGLVILKTHYARWIVERAFSILNRYESRFPRFIVRVSNLRSFRLLHLLPRFGWTAEVRQAGEIIEFEIKRRNECGPSIW